MIPEPKSPEIIQRNIAVIQWLMILAGLPLLFIESGYLLAVFITGIVLRFIYLAIQNKNNKFNYISGFMYIGVLFTMCYQLTGISLEGWVFVLLAFLYMIYIEWRCWQRSKAPKPA